MERYSTHSLHTTLTLWREKLPNERPENYMDLELNPKNAYVRLRWVLRDLKDRLDKLNPMLAQTNVLTSIEHLLSQLDTPWTQYLSDPNSLWQQLDNHTDTLINNIRNLMPNNGMAADHESLEELRSDMNSVIEEAQTTIKNLQSTATSTEEQFQNIHKLFEELTLNIDTQKTRLDTMLNQHSEAFSKVQLVQATQFTKTEEERGIKFSEALEQKKSTFETLVNNFNNTKTEVIKKHQEELASIESVGQEKSNELLALINGQLDKAVEIVGTIVPTVMSGSYTIIANREYKNAWFMRAVAILAFLGMAGMVIWAVSSMDLTSNGIEWSTFAFRLSLGTAFLIPGIYCAKEASRHWNAEKHNRRIAMELAALDPFLVPLDEANRKALIEKKADEYFGQGAYQIAEENLLTLKNITLRGDQMLKLLERLLKMGHIGGK